MCAGVLQPPHLRKACVRRFKKGYKNIINKGQELNAAGVPCPLMMETSGHGAMRVGATQLWGHRLEAYVNLRHGNSQSRFQKRLDCPTTSHAFPHLRCVAFNSAANLLPPLLLP